MSWASSGPGIQKKSDNQNKVICVNHLIGITLGTMDIASGEVYSRSNHGFKSLPAAVRARNRGGRTLSLGTGGLIHLPVGDVQRLRNRSLVRR
jgi:hypothetical protein